MLSARKYLPARICSFVVIPLYKTKYNCVIKSMKTQNKKITSIEKTQVTQGEHLKHFQRAPCSSHLKPDNGKWTSITYFIEQPDVETQYFPIATADQDKFITSKMRYNTKFLITRLNSAW